jgi:hypothetical protein
VKVLILGKRKRVNEASKLNQWGSGLGGVVCRLINLILYQIPRDFPILRGLLLHFFVLPVNVDVFQ